MNSREIIGFLQERYYSENNTPEHMVSSFWKRCQKTFEVAFDGAEIKALKGSGFGLPPKESILEKFSSWSTIISYLGILNNRREVISLLKYGASLAGKMGEPFSYDCFRQICTFGLLIGTLNREG